ncbi:MAG: acetyl-CoA C-acetyltransferase [Bacteriovoracaceae bacterium]|jgi:acetyl-CoA C-acetyltransferase|nr:acetyl-CoA C-acetyltransferase [Bacteriovoracaceae bacterium]
MGIRKVVIVGGVRIPFVKSFTKYKNVSNKDMLTHVLQALVKKYKLQGKRVDEVALGAVMKHADDWNMARESVLSSGLAKETPAYDLQRACGTSLSAFIQLANKIALGQIDVGIAAGADSNSDAPLELSKSLSKKLMDFNSVRSFANRLAVISKIRPSDFIPKVPTAGEPRTGKTMGKHCEMMAQEWNISRKEQDELAAASHQNGVKAYAEGFHKNLVVPYQGIEQDTILREGTTVEKLSNLKAVFDGGPKGTLTAANSTPLTDGAAAVLLCSEQYAEENNLSVLATFVDAQIAAIDFEGGEGLLMAPAYAVPKLLQKNGLTLQDFDFYEIHEAFAAQVLCTLKAWESDDFCKNKLGLDGALGSIDRSKLNIKGGSVALGHPFAATGARITTTLAELLNQAGSGRGLISICTAGGMGVTAILEKNN